MAEYYNTISNIAFLLVGFIGLHRAVRKGLNASFLYCEIMVSGGIPSCNQCASASASASTN